MRHSVDESYNRETAAEQCKDAFLNMHMAYKRSGVYYNVLFTCRFSELHKREI